MNESTLPENDVEALLQRWENVIICPECADTVLFRENEFKDSHLSDSVYCTCDEVGYPMVPAKAHPMAFKYVVGKRLS
jgi:hypothetical protein